MSAPDDVLDRNLRKLLRRAWPRVAPRPIFRSALKARFLRGAGVAPSREWTPRGAPARWIAVAAAVLVGVVVMQFAQRPDAPSADSLASILARGAVALRDAPSAEFVAARSPRAAFAAPFLEIATAPGTSFGVDVAGRGAFDLAPASRVEIVAEDRAAVRAFLREGGLTAGVRGEPLAVATPHGAVAVAAGRLDLALERMEGDPAGSPSVRLFLDSGAAEVESKGATESAGAIEPGVPYRLRDGRLESLGPRIASPGEREPADIGRPGSSDPTTAANEPSPTDAATPGAKAILVHGVVRVAGRPHDEFEAFIVRYTGTGGEPAFEARGGAIRSPEGRYAFEDPVGGRFRVFIRAEGYAVAVSEPFFGADAPVTLDFDLASGATIRGRVVDAATREPIAGVLVFSENEVPQSIAAFSIEAMKHGSGIPQRAVRSGEDGRFELEHVAPGEPLLRGVIDGYAPAWLSVKGVRDFESREDVEIALEHGGRIVGMVRDKDGAPRKHSIVIAMNQTLAVPILAMSSAVARSLDDGRYAIADLPAGLYMVLDLGPEPVGMPDFNRMQLVMVEPRGEVVVDFGPLPEGCLLDGRLLDAAGGPIAGATLSIALAGEASYADPQDWRTGLTDAEGRFRIGPLDPGRHEVFRVTTGTFIERIAVIDVPDVASATVELTLAENAIAGVVVAASDGRPVPGAYVILLRDDESGGEPRFAGKGPADEKGAFAFRGLLPGVYRVGVVLTGGGFAARWTETIAIASGSGPAAPLRVAMRTACQLKLDIRDETGELVRQAVVTSVVDSQGDDYADLITWRDDSAGLTCDDLPAGELTISIKREGFEPLETRITVREGVPTTAKLVLRGAR